VTPILRLFESPSGEWDTARCLGAATCDSLDRMEVTSDGMIKGTLALHRLDHFRVCPHLSQVLLLRVNPPSHPHSNHVSLHAREQIDRVQSSFADCEIHRGTVRGWHGSWVSALDPGTLMKQAQIEGHTQSE
jgi:hypothetical protein